MIIFWSVGPPRGEKYEFVPTIGLCVSYCDHEMSQKEEEPIEFAGNVLGSKHFSWDCFSRVNFWRGGSAWGRIYTNRFSYIYQGIDDVLRTLTEV